jgi:NAD+ kinase
MQVIIFGKHFKETHRPVVEQLFNSMARHELTCFVFSEYFEEIKEKIKLPTVCGIVESHLDLRTRKFDAVLVLGGDGTMLAAVNLVRDSGVPILGINLGRLGFLASTDKNSIEDAVSSLARGAFRLDERSLLYLESSPSGVFGDLPIALNDCTILKRDTSSMITIDVFLNGAFLNAYWADGIIISTPTGSTGYSLSCGGPIIFPDSQNFVLTPVAPHNLNMRPLVISDNSILSFEIDGRSDNFLCTLDSRFETVPNECQLAIRKNDYPIKLISLENHSFLRTIREKLMWGSDMRN